MLKPCTLCPFLRTILLCSVVLVSLSGGVIAALPDQVGGVQVATSTPIPTPTLLPCTASSECLLPTEVGQRWPGGYTQYGSLPCGYSTTRSATGGQVAKYCYQPVQVSCSKPYECMLESAAVEKWGAGGYLQYGSNFCGQVANPAQKTQQATMNMYCFGQKGQPAAGVTPFPVTSTVPPTQPAQERSGAPAAIPAQKQVQEPVPAQVVPAGQQGNVPPNPPGLKSSGQVVEEKAAPQPGILDSILGFITGLLGGLTGQKEQIPPQTSMMVHMNAQHTGDYSSVSGQVRPTGGVNWEVFMPWAVLHHFRTSVPAIANDIAYVGGPKNLVYAIFTENGTVKWIQDVGANMNDWGADPVVAGGIVYVVGDGILYALDSETGAPIWNHASGFGGYSFTYSPTVANNTAFIPFTQEYGYDGGVMALDAKTGTEFWHYNNAVTGDANSAFSSCPVIAGDMLYIAGAQAPNMESPSEVMRTPQILAFNAWSGGEPIWSIATNDVVSCPAYADGRLFVNDELGELTAYDSTTGAVLWTAQAGDGDLKRWYDSPAVADGIVFLAGDTKGKVDTVYGGKKIQLYTPMLFAFDASTGKVLWTYSDPDRNGIDLPPDGFSSPAVSDGVVYFSDPSYLHALDTGSGRLLWKLMDSQEGSSPVVYKGVIYSNDYWGSIIAIGNKHPSITAVHPNIGQSGRPLRLTVEGTDFQPGTQISVTFRGTDLDIHTRYMSDISVQNDTTLLGTLDLSVVAQGSYPLAIKNPDGKTGDSDGVSLGVTDQPVPVITRITPDSGYRDSPLSVVIEGSGFMKDSTVALRNVLGAQTPIGMIQGEGVEVSESRITCTFNLTRAGTGTYDVTVGSARWGNNYVELPGAVTILPPMTSTKGQVAYPGVKQQTATSANGQG